MVPLIIAGAALTAYSNWQAGKARKEQNEINAQLALRAADDALQRGTVGQGRARTQGSEIIGKARVLAANSNIDVQSGAVLDSIGKTRMMSEMDAQMIRTNALREAYGYKVRAAAFRVAGDNEMDAGGLAATGTLIGGAGQGYQAYRMANPPGDSGGFGGPTSFFNDAPATGTPMSLLYDPSTLPSFGRG